LGGPEGDLLARLDLDRLTGRRIAAHARRTLPHLQDAEPTDPDAVALLEVFDDHLHEIIEDRLGLLLRHFMFTGETGGAMLQRDGRLRGLGHLEIPPNSTSSLARETLELPVTYAILAALDYAQFQKSPIFVANLGGQW